VSAAAVRSYQDEFPVVRKLQHVPFDWKGKSVAEVGCNIGGLGLYALERGAVSYVGSDLIASYVEEGRRRHPELDLRHAESAAAPVDADVLVALGVFHHMRDEQITDLLARTSARWILCEQPMGDVPFKNYWIRPATWYANALFAAGFTSWVWYRYGFSYPIDRRILVGVRG
jgi:SAM-dependent methyltransferase